MSLINHSVTNAEVIPLVEGSHLFVGHESARFAVGMLAMGEEIAPGLEDVYNGYLKLRARVYADQTQMISKNLVRPDGTETDEDDGRAVHFGVLEQNQRGVRVVGAMRLILKNWADPRPLPIESFFPEVFHDVQAPIGATEASRYILRHEDPKVQENLNDPLFSAAVSYIVGHELGPTFGVVEENVERHLRKKGVPIKRIAEPLYVPEYAADNLGIEVNTALLAHNMIEKDPGLVAKLLDAEWNLTYFGKQQQQQQLAAAA